MKEFKQICREYLLERISFELEEGNGLLDLRELAHEVIDDMYVTYPEYYEYVELMDIYNPYQFILSEGSEC